MPTMDWAFLCDYATVDAAGKASIMGIFESVSARQLPMNHPQMYIALGMKLSPGDNFEISSKITSPSGKDVHQVKQQRISVPADAPGVGKGVIAFGFFGTNFTETGEHHIEIFIDGNSVHFIPIQVVLDNRRP